MRAWLVDAYRNKDKIVLWLKAGGKDIRLERQAASVVYAAYSANLERYLKSKKIRYSLEERPNYKGELLKVFSFRLSSLSRYERLVRFFEKKTKHRLRLYNADILPEQMFLYEHNLVPCSLIEISDTEIARVDKESAPPLHSMAIEIAATGDVKSENSRIKEIVVDQKVLEGEEETILKELSELFSKRDPDVIFMPRAFVMIEFLEKRLSAYGLKCQFHRWDPTPLKSRGGKSFFSYGNIVYRDFAVRLHGRLLVDTTTMVGSDCSAEGIMELCQLSGMLFQQIASRSFGATFQTALVREMIQRGQLVPFKEKPVDTPFTMFELMKGDRVGHTLDPKVGFHKNVAELDFSSMYPWIIYNHNISTETIQSDEGPFESVPGLPIRISLKTRGVVPTVIKPFLDRRMKYKAEADEESKRKAKGLKWVLVTSYGYLRFREFKLGNASTHMAIGAFAREALLKAVAMAEEKGFEVIHGIIDSLYIKKEGITEKEVRELCREIELAVGIPLGFEGIFKWAVFLPSITDKLKPVATHYYGAFEDGSIKVRGIELRCKNSPPLVKLFQNSVIKDMAGLGTYGEIQNKIPTYARFLRETVSRLGEYDPKLLVVPITLSKTEYKHNIPQKLALSEMKKKGYELMPGQKVRFIYGRKGIVLPEDYTGLADESEYKRLLSRALYMLLEPFVEDRNSLDELLEKERQTRLSEFLELSSVAQIFIKNKAMIPG